MRIAVCPFKLLGPLAPLTSALAPMAEDLPSASSVADCAQFYYGCLSTKQRCKLRLLLGSSWRVGTACNRTDSVVKVMEQLGRSNGWKFNHAFSCECDKEKQIWMRQDFPLVPFDIPKRLRFAQRAGF
jgi:hypothetical protein